MEIDIVALTSLQAASGDGTVANVGLKLRGDFPCSDCRQRFDNAHAREVHWRFFHGIESVDRQSDVQWMASGGAVCRVRLPSNVFVNDVKAEVERSSGVPIQEQRLFAGDVELVGDTPISAAVSAAGGAPLKLVRTITDPRVTDLGQLRVCPSTIRPLPEGEFVMLRRLANGVAGDIFLYKRQELDGGSSDVVIKKLRNDRLQTSGMETDDRSAHFGLSKRCAPNQEDPLTEIGVLTYLARQDDLPAYLLKAQGVFTQGNHTLLVMEYACGGDLFNQVSRQGPLSVPQAKMYTRQMLEAVAYLHKHLIAHRDLSLENVLIQDGDLRIMDFGMAARSHSSSGTPLRYFRSVGKDFYRAPECYVPSRPTVDVLSPVGKACGDVVASKHGAHLCEVKLLEAPQKGKYCRAEVWGYAACPVDVFAVGVCLFICLHGFPPWQQTTLLDNYYAFVYEKSLQKLLEQWNMSMPSEEALDFFNSTTRRDPSRRPTAAACLTHRWLSDEGVGPRSPQACQQH